MSPTDDFLGMRPGSPWRRRLQWIATALALVALIVLIGRFVNGGEVTRYATASIERADLQATLAGTGVLQPTGRRGVVAGMTGTVAEVLVQDGDPITSGQLLARLDSASAVEEVARADALIGARDEALAAATANERNLREQLRRFEEVRRRSQGLVPSDREMTLARDGLRQATDRQRDASVELEAARTTLTERQAQLAATDIRAPTDGFVVRRLVGPGQQITAHDHALLEIAAPPTHLLMEVMVDRAMAQTLRKGASAQVSTATNPRRSFPASIVAVRPARSADETRSIVSLDVSNPDKVLQPGMTAAAQIGLGVRKNALVAPEEALRFAQASDADQGGGEARGDAVYVLGEQGAPRRIPVTIDGGDGRRRAVVSPALQPGAIVITGLR